MKQEMQDEFKTTKTKKKSKKQVKIEINRWKLISFI
jgi:hypothetical protein